MFHKPVLPEKNSFFPIRLVLLFVVLMTLPFFVQYLQAHNREIVLGTQAQLYVSSRKDSYTSNGVVMLTSTEEPAITIDGYELAGTLEIELYKANDDALLDYLTHDNQMKQLTNTPDRSKITYVTTIKEKITNPSSQKILLPLEKKGIWYIKTKFGEGTNNAFIVRSGIGALAKEGDDKFIFWVQNLFTKKSQTDGVVILYNLQNTRKELARIPVNQDGIAEAPLTKDADIALVASGDERSVIPLNLTDLSGYGSSYSFTPKVKQSRYFIFTDRPIYNPGDTVYFKAIIRDDDDARYNIPAGTATVEIYSGYYYEGMESTPENVQTLAISPHGTIQGTYTIPKTVKTGVRNLRIILPSVNQTRPYGWREDYSSNIVEFAVEHFKKPEYFMNVTTPQTEIIASDPFSFTVDAKYFSGQPLINQQIKYQVYAGDYYEYAHLADRMYENDFSKGWYDYYYSSRKIAEGTATLDSNGRVEIPLETTLPFAEGKSQIFTINASLADSSLTPDFATKNVLVYAGEYGVYKQNYTYTTKVKTPLTLPVSLVLHKDKGNITDVSITAHVKREDWVSYQEENKKYPSYKRITENLPNIEAKTDNNGNAVFRLLPEKTGWYTFLVEGKDTKNNLVRKEFGMYVSDDNIPFYISGKSQQNLTIATDKKNYQPNETVQIDLFSYIPDRDALLTFERGRVDRYQVVHFSGKNKQVPVILQPQDVPNTYIDVTSFDETSLNKATENIRISPDNNMLSVRIQSDKKMYGPGETAKISIETKDRRGSPVAADVALWVVDKAIFEVAPQTLGNIFDTFWHERGNGTKTAYSLESIFSYGPGGGGGCFVAGTKVLMNDFSEKNIELVKAGDEVLTYKSESDKTMVKARVLTTHTVTEPGYLILNNTLKVTANHKIWSNNGWTEAGSLQIGDLLLQKDGTLTSLRSIAWQQEKVPVYNLTVETYHTYIANGIWVHNDKGESRSIFRDTAYWNPDIQTDSSGKAAISFKIPDNLTTWTIAAVGNTTDTNVGQTTDEFVVSKNISIRPVLPTILRVGDTLVLKSLVQNFTDTAHTFTTSLDFDAGTVQSPVEKTVTVASRDSQTVSWNIATQKASEAAHLHFKAIANEQNSDEVINEIPVRTFAFSEKRGASSEGSKTYPIQLSQEIDTAQSSIKLSLTPSLYGSLPTAISYLAAYPYGCMEQTTSKLVPIVLNKKYPALFTTNQIPEESIRKLIDNQNADGGWAWWKSNTTSNAFVSAHVIEYVVLAKQFGADVPDETLTDAKKYVESHPDTELSTTRAAKLYAAMRLGIKQPHFTNQEMSTLTPELLAMSVIAHYQNGDTNPQTNGLSLLMSKAQTQGNTAFWEKGDRERFGTRILSTAWALRALTETNTNTELATKAVRFITQQKNNYYWDNTYATAQVIRALADFSAIDNELNPNYSYTVSLDGKIVAKGTVTSAKQKISDITIPAQNLSQGKGTLVITKNGTGQLYSTILIDEMHTNPKTKSASNGIAIERTYSNESNGMYEKISPQVGDIMQVSLRIRGLKSEDMYGVIHDELPGGMVPVNESLQNEQYNAQSLSGNNNQHVEFSENGATFSLSTMQNGVYTYRARVVSEGVFNTPPATVSLMYNPQVWARSDAQVITILQNAPMIPDENQISLTPINTPQTQPKITPVILLLLLLALGVLVIKKRRH